MTRKNSKAMNHFRLRKYPIIYMNGVTPPEIQHMIDDYVRQDSGKQISQRILEIIKQELIIKAGLQHQDSFINPDEIKDIQTFSNVPPSPNANDINTKSLVVDNKKLTPGGFSLFQGLTGMN